MDKARELTAVIEANHQRIKSDALLAEEAKRLTEAYTKRREAGEDLPGRIRDRVAEAMQISKTKLGTLSAIRNGLNALQGARYVELCLKNRSRRRFAGGWLAKRAA